MPVEFLEIAGLNNGQEKQFISTIIPRSGHLDEFFVVGGLK